MKRTVIILIMLGVALTGCSGIPQAASTPGEPAKPATAGKEIGKLQPLAGPGPAGEVAYTGAINGDLGIRMRLKIQDGKVSGSYYYDSVRKDIVLRGKVDGPQIRITEYDEQGKDAATFYGAFFAPGRIEGVWTVYNPEKEGQFRDKWLKIYPFYLDGEGKKPKVAGPDPASYKKAWEGTWRRPVSTSSTYGEVKISFATDRSFWFEMFQFAGANSRQLRSMAVMEGNDAVFRDGRGGEMRFIRKNGQLVVEPNDKMSRYVGAGVSFAGDFTRGETRRQTLAEIGVLESAAQEELFKQMTGPYYKKFVDNFHMGGRIESLDGPQTKAFFGYVRGIAPYEQGMIVRSDEGAIWAALLTFVNSRRAYVYFASDGNADGQMPQTIEKWIADKQQKREKKLEAIRYRQ